MSDSERSRVDVAVIGAGVGGLVCAQRLQQAGLSVALLEASDRPGGRVGGVERDGFVLDHGFQVFLEAYPECRQVLDYDALDLRPFYAGAKIWTGQGLVHLADPWRHPLGALRTALAPVWSLSDLVALPRLVARLTRGELEQAWATDSVPARQLLRECGVSRRLTDTFFRPFFGGVFFDTELETSARMLAFTLRMFAAGRATLPARGMQAISDQLAARLQPGALRLETPVERVAQGGLTLSDGSRLAAETVVLATPHTETARLLGERASQPWRETATLAFAAAEAPVQEPILVLDGTGRGPVNHLAVPSVVSPHYAPAGQHLVLANTVGPVVTDDARLEAAARQQLRGWFGPAVDSWRLLELRRIPQALPDQAPPALDPAHRSPRLDRPELGCELYLAGEQIENASINGAMVGGRRAAEAVLEARTVAAS